MLAEAEKLSINRVGKILSQKIMSTQEAKVFNLSSDNRVEKVELRAGSSFSFAVPADAAAQLSLSNPSSRVSVPYTIFVGSTNTVYKKGTLGPGGSFNEKIAPSDTPKTFRVHNDYPYNPDNPRAGVLDLIVQLTGAVLK